MPDFTTETANQMHRACRYFQSDWEPGSTEPWIIDIVAALLIASNQRQVVELGGYKGTCSRTLALALELLGGGHLVVVEYDAALAQGLANAVLPSATVSVTVLHQEAVEAIRMFPDRSIGFAWVDDSHDTPHVVEEMENLIPKMVDDGIICFHDVTGHYGLANVVRGYGGYTLDLPRVSSSGGLGILQVTPETRQRHLRIAAMDEALGPEEQRLAWLKLYGQEDEGLHYAPVG